MGTLTCGRGLCLCSNLIGVGEEGRRGRGGGREKQKMVGRLGEEVCVAVRRMCSVSGVLAKPVGPTNVSSTIPLTEVRVRKREREREM